MTRIFEKNIDIIIDNILDVYIITVGQWREYLKNIDIIIDNILDVYIITVGQWREYLKTLASLLIIS